MMLAEAGFVCAATLWWLLSETLDRGTALVS